MTATIRPVPVRKRVRVAAPAERAWCLPPESDAGGRERTTSRPAIPDRFVIELREGGRWFERSVDGVECEIRKVRILLLAWSSTGNSAPTLRLIPR